MDVIEVSCHVCSKPIGHCNGKYVDNICCSFSCLAVANAKGLTIDSPVVSDVVDESVDPVI